MRTQIFIVFCIISLIFARAPLTIDELKCQGTPELCNITCTLNTMRKGLTLMDFYLLFLKPLQKVQLHYTLFKKTSGAYQVFMVDIKEDICEMLNGGRLSGFLSRLLVSLKEFGFKAPTCPIQGFVNLTNLRMDFSFMPSVIPKGSYKSRVFVSDLDYKNEVLEINQLFTIN